MARKKGRQLDTRAALLDAAWQLFGEHGFAGTSVDAIVARAGLSKGTFFHYFASKLELLEAVCARVVDASFAELAGVLDQPRASAATRLNRLLGAMRQWRLGHAGVLVDIWRAVERDALLRLRLAELANSRVLPLLVRIVEQGNAEGTFEVADPEETARLLIAMLGSAGNDNLRLLSAAGGGEEVAATIARRSDAVSAAIERLLGARRGTVKRIDLKVVRKLLQSPSP